ncbi:MAG: transcription antitermination factor NusB [Phycisphaerae bacterium]|nr:transcription antitermination factor NusB [Phycisphaerae bacterium]
MTNNNKNSETVGSRRQSRQLALQFLYQLDVQKGRPIEMLDKFLAENTADLEIRKIARQWIRGTWNGLAHIDATIKEVSANWDINRISIVDRSNLRLAIYQLLDCPDVPAKVVINEAIELAKVFSTAQSSKFVNGVLDAVVKKMLNITEQTIDETETETEKQD